MEVLITGDLASLVDVVIGPGLVGFEISSSCLAYCPCQGGQGAVSDSGPGRWNRLGFVARLLSC